MSAPGEAKTRRVRRRAISGDRHATAPSIRRRSREVGE